MCSRYESNSVYHLERRTDTAPFVRRGEYVCTSNRERGTRIGQLLLVAALRTLWATILKRPANHGNRLGHWKMVVGVIIVVHAAACSTVGLGASYSNTGTGNAKVTAGAAVNFPTTDAVGVPGLDTFHQHRLHFHPVVTNIGGADSAWNGSLENYCCPHLLSRVFPVKAQVLSRMKRSRIAT